MIITLSDLFVIYPPTDIIIMHINHENNEIMHKNSGKEAVYIYTTYVIAVLRMCPVCLRAYV